MQASAQWRRFFLTDAEDDLVDVDSGEVQEEEGEVDDEKEEAQNHTHPLLEPLAWEGTQTTRRARVIYPKIIKTHIRMLGKSTGYHEGVEEEEVEGVWL